LLPQSSAYSRCRTDADTAPRPCRPRTGTPSVAETPTTRTAPETSVIAWKLPLALRIPSNNQQHQTSRRSLSKALPLRSPKQSASQLRGHSARGGWNPDPSRVAESDRLADGHDDPAARQGSPGCDSLALAPSWMSHTRPFDRSALTVRCGATDLVINDRAVQADR
jgi:hypothetical protein